MENTIVTQLSNARTAAQARLAEIEKEREELRAALGETPEPAKKQRLAIQRTKLTKAWAKSAPKARKPRKAKATEPGSDLLGSPALSKAMFTKRKPRTPKTDATIPAPPPRKSRAPKVSDGKCEAWILSELKREASKVGPLVHGAPFKKAEVNRTLKSLRTAGKIEMQGNKRGAVYSLAEVSDSAETNKAAE